MIIKKCAPEINQERNDLIRYVLVLALQIEIDSTYIRNNKNKNHHSNCNIHNLTLSFCF